MKKSRGILSLILIAAVIASLGVTTAHGLNPKGMGAAKNINLGLDLEGGVSITYEAVGETPSDEDMKDTVYKLQLCGRVQHRGPGVPGGRQPVGIEIPAQDANGSWKNWGSRVPVFH